MASSLCPSSAVIAPFEHRQRQRGSSSSSLSTVKCRRMELLKFGNGVAAPPCISVINDQSLPSFMTSPRIQDIGGGKQESRLRIFSGTTNRPLAQEFNCKSGLRQPTILGVREHVFTGRF